MKKFIYVIFLVGIFILESQTIFCKDSYLKKIDTGAASVFTLKNESMEDSTYSLQGYAKAHARDFDFNAGYKIPTTVFGQNVDADGFSYGGSFYLKNLLGVPLTFSGGKLGFSGSISKLNNPTISSGVSIFSNASSSAVGISNSLPGVASASKPLSALARYDYAQTKSVFRNLRAVCFYDENKNFAQSLFFAIKPSKNLQVSISETVGAFWVKNTSSSWFSAWQLFPEKQILCASAQIGLNSPFYKGRFFTNFYQLENQALGNTFTLENNISVSNFKLNLWGFLSDSAKIFTSSSSKLKTLWQVKLNPSMDFLILKKTALLRVGGIFYVDEKMENLEKTKVSYKWSGGFDLKKRTFQTRWSLSGSQDYYTLGASASFPSKLKPYFSTSYSIWTNSEDFELEKQRIKASASIYIIEKNNFSINAKNSLELTFKDSTTSGTSTISLYAKQKTKYANMTESLGIKYKF